ncbi:hypothetical protein RA28_16845 [Ruegeria sp. ANG-S4]|uniref:hypothetical protein n=1 Tax=Ruegeria sp. ANG-S4 TaxID=1577904 RepID=UPI000580925E|nr:hypothetical protein [Ruegeria sp. ANG-S4]KIC44562.1 hypothetical protein RA28_16845 [Ruegeria sp. ANG-S4]
MAQGFSLKDQLFNAEKTRYLAGLFSAADQNFDAATFEAQVMSRLLELELKERMAWIAECLQQSVPGDLPAIAPLLLRALPPPLDPNKSDDDFGDFIFAPLGDWVVAVGLDHPELALDVLEELTQRFSMEWAIRPFLNRYPEIVLKRMEAWCGHSSYHVRRLVSEGTRPRLPWGQSVDLELTDPLPLLDRLHADSTRYVTRSVANHLNDITKKDVKLALDRLQAWQDSQTQDTAELKWMTSHAVRGLVKSGHPRAMKMIGYDPDADVSAHISLGGDARIGGALDFEVRLSGARDQAVLVDYIVHFQRPGGKVSAKVHKLKQAALKDGELVLKKTHKLKGNASTFTLIPGAHRLEVQVNGRVRAAADFELLG